jgi:hypothetical protein
MLEEPDKIDMAFALPDGKLMLVITDAGITSDAEQRLGYFVAKLRTYLGYILSDEFTAEHPKHKPTDVVIRVMCAQPPSAQMQGMTRITPAERKDLSIPIEFQHFPRP